MIIACDYSWETCTLVTREIRLSGAIALVHTEKMPSSNQTPTTRGSKLARWSLPWKEPPTILQPERVELSSVRFLPRNEGWCGLKVLDRACQGCNTSGLHNNSTNGHLWREWHVSENMFLAVYWTVKTLYLLFTFSFYTSFYTVVLWPSLLPPTSTGARW